MRAIAINIALLTEGVRRALGAINIALLTEGVLHPLVLLLTLRS